MAQEPDLLISAGFSDAQLVRESNKVVAAFKKRGEEAQKAFQDASGRVTNTTAAKAHVRELDRLSKAYDPVYRAASRYEAEVKRLDRALDVGAISQSAYTTKVAEAAREMQQATTATTGFGQRASSASRGVATFDRGVVRATGGVGQFRSQIQNSAFQFQDFVVQVQSGTAASIAFAQQAPQLLGGFGAVGAVLGLVAALAVPVGAALFRLGGESDDAAKMAEAFDKSLQSAQSALSEFNDTINTQSLGSIEALIEKYGRADAAVRDLENRMREAFRSDAFEGYQSTIDQQALGSLIGADSQVAQVFGRVQELRAEIATAEADVSRYSERAAASDLPALFTQYANDARIAMAAAQQNAAELRSEVEQIGIKPEQIDTFNEAKDALDAALAEQNFTGAIAALDTIQAVLRETGDSTLVNVANQLDTVAAQLQEGAAKAGELPPELAAAADEALALADYLAQAVGAINSLQSAIGNLGISNVGKQARLAALEAGQSAGEATIAGRVAERRAELEDAFDPNDANFTGVQRELSEYEAGLREELRLTDEISRLEDQLKPGRSGRGGAGGGGRKRTGGRGRTEKTPADILEEGAQDLVNLERQIELIGKSNEEVAVARARWELLDAAKKAGIPVNDQMNGQIEAQAAKIGQLTGELERGELAYEQFSDGIGTIVDALFDAGDAGENFVDRLKRSLVDAGLQASIASLKTSLSDLFAPKGGGGGGFFGNLFGGLFGGSSFDGGGYTGMGARSGGIDGKGGFPAILHPNETVVDHTRGQSAGSRSVSMTIDLRGTTGDRELDAKISRAGQQILAQVPTVMDNENKRRR